MWYEFFLKVAKSKTSFHLYSFIHTVHALIHMFVDFARVQGQGRHGIQDESEVSLEKTYRNMTEI